MMCGFNKRCAGAIRPPLLGVAVRPFRATPFALLFAVKSLARMSRIAMVVFGGYWMTAPAFAETRVTTAITLPFQQAAQGASSSAEASNYQLRSLTLAPTAPPQTQAQTQIQAQTQTQAQQPQSQQAQSQPQLQTQAAQASSSAAQPAVASAPKIQAATTPAQVAPPAVTAAAQASVKPAPPAAPKTPPVPPAKAATSKAAPVAKPTVPGPVAGIVPQFAAPVKSVGAFNTAQMHAVEMPASSGQAFVKEFEEYIELQVAPYVPGVAVAILSQGQLKSLRTFGVRTAGTRNMVTPDTVFRLASSSKPVAATAIAMYTRSGKLSLNDKVTQVLPNVVFKQPRHGNLVTLKHLLSQGVGLPQHSNSSAIDIGIDYEEAVRRLRLVNFVCAPGKCYAYQNVTYSLAGDMVAQKAGRAFESVVEDLLFAPLGMHSASFGRASYLASPNRAVPHIAQGKRWVPTDVTENWYRVGPAAGVNASIVDMARFGLAHLGRRGDVVNIQTLNQVQSRVQPNTKGQSHYASREAVSNTAYGLGWRVFDYGKNKNYIHHGGWVKGFRTEMVFNRELGIGMVFLCNSESRLARDVVFKFLDMHVASQQAARKAR